MDGRANDWPVLADVEAAAARLAGHAVMTPLLRSDALDVLTGARVFLKAECLQRTGSFKFRGAYNALAQLAPGTPVVAYSSGNHAQAVALAGRLLGLPTTIVMPADAPALKIARTREYGATVVLYDRARESREAIGAALCDRLGAALVPPFDDARVIAGQGTVGLEARAQLATLDLSADVALVCCGGGGLASGIALGLGVPVVTVEPEAYDDVARSLADGVIRTNTGFPPTLADALQTVGPGVRTFGILSAHGVRGIAVPETAIANAVRFAFAELRLVIEPGGAVALASALTGAIDLTGQVAVVTLSGGNVDAALFGRLIG